METSTTVPESAAALHDGIDALTDEVIDGLRAQLPSYAAVSADRLRPRVLASLRNGLSLVERWAEERRSARGAGRVDGPAYGIPETHLDEVTDLAQALPVEDIISAYRIGTDIVWRRFGEEMTARGGTAEDLLPVAETLRTWVDANTLRIVRECRVGLRGGDPAADRRHAAMVRALLLGEARWDMSLGGLGAGAPGAPATAPPTGTGPRAMPTTRRPWTERMGTAPSVSPSARGCPTTRPHSAIRAAPPPPRAIPAPVTVLSAGSSICCVPGSPWTRRGAPWSRPWTGMWRDCWSGARPGSAAA